MASEGDAGLTHLAGIEANSDGGISGFSFTGLSADYQHLAFRMHSSTQLQLHPQLQFMVGSHVDQRAQHQ